MTCSKQFFDAYVNCALWASSDESNDQGGVPLDANYTPVDLDDSALRSMKADCDTFYESNRADIDNVKDDSACGHDFWLTRNHHGTGFWDRGLGEIGERLTKAAHAYGESYLYLDTYHGYIFVS